MQSETLKVFVLKPSVLYDVNVKSIIALFSPLIVFFCSLMPIEKMGDVENSEIPCTPWTTRMPKYAQPNLNYIGKKKNLTFPACF